MLVAVAHGVRDAGARSWCPYLQPAGETKLKSPDPQWCRLYGRAGDSGGTPGGGTKSATSLKTNKPSYLVRALLVG
jgi:hypothetical protein